jgi:hypothetical protein
VVLVGYWQGGTGGSAGCGVAPLLWGGEGEEIWYGAPFEWM